MEEETKEPSPLRILDSTSYGDASRDPLLSVLLISPIGFEALGETWRALQQQTVCEQLELVLVTSGPAELSPEHWRPFLRVVHLTTGDMGCMGEAAAVGVRAASGAIIARTEDHCFPRRDWAERFAEAFRNVDDAGVGPTVHSANPGSVMSDVNYTLEYAWAGPDMPKGPAPFLPGHNSCYRREVLLSLGDDLGWWLESETVCTGSSRVVVTASRWPPARRPTTGIHHGLVRRSSSFRPIPGSSQRVADGSFRPSSAGRCAFFGRQFRWLVSAARGEPVGHGSGRCECCASLRCSWCFCWSQLGPRESGTGSARRRICFAAAWIVRWIGPGFCAQERRSRSVRSTEDDDDGETSGMAARREQSRPRGSASRRRAVTPTHPKRRAR